MFNHPNSNCDAVITETAIASSSCFCNNFAMISFTAMVLLDASSTMNKVSMISAWQVSRNRNYFSNNSQYNSLCTAILGKKMLLRFGFLSSYSDLKDLAIDYGLLVDGRADLSSAASVFDPPKARFKVRGAASVNMKNLIYL